jgi:hypothetical protein
MVGGIICGIFGVSAAGKSLEDIADPLSLVEGAEKEVTPESAVPRSARSHSSRSD